MIIKCVVACRSFGSPEFVPVQVKCTEYQYENGCHYDAASIAADEAKYDDTELVFDENDGPEWLFKQFEWEFITTVECEIQ